MDLWEEIQDKINKLDKAISQLATNGYDYAEKERNYKIGVCKKALELKDQGVPATLINLIIYGIDDIPDLRLARDASEVKYNANQEYINNIKLQIRILESQLNREYGNAK